MPKRLAVLVLLTLPAVLDKAAKFFKNYKWKNWKKDLGELSFGILWISLFIWLLVGLVERFI